MMGSAVQVLFSLSRAQQTMEKKGKPNKQRGVWCFCVRTQ